jgi:hypothetical protein
MDARMDQETLAELSALEESLWRAETRFDDELMDKTFAPDFFEFGRSGRTYTRDEMLFRQSGFSEINATLPLPNFRARYLADDVAQVTYVSEVVYDGRKELGNRSSIWSRIDGTWKLRFHQGTPTH